MSQNEEIEEPLTKLCNYLSQSIKHFSIQNKQNRKELNAFTNSCYDLISAVNMTCNQLRNEYAKQSRLMEQNLTDLYITSFNLLVHSLIEKLADSELGLKGNLCTKRPQMIPKILSSKGIEKGQKTASFELPSSNFSNQQNTVIVSSESTNTPNFVFTTAQRYEGQAARIVEALEANPVQGNFLIGKTNDPFLLIETSRMLSMKIMDDFENTASWLKKFENMSSTQQLPSDYSLGISLVEKIRSSFQEAFIQMTDLSGFGSVEPFVLSTRENHQLLLTSLERELREYMLPMLRRRIDIFKSNMKAENRTHKKKGFSILDATNDIEVKLIELVYNEPPEIIIETLLDYHRKCKEHMDRISWFEANIGVSVCTHSKNNMATEESEKHDEEMPKESTNRNERRRTKANGSLKAVELVSAKQTVLQEMVKHYSKVVKKIVRKINKDRSDNRLEAITGTQYLEQIGSHLNKILEKRRMRFQQQKENMEKQRLTGLFDDLMLNSIIEELMIPCTNQSDNSISETQAILSQRKTIAYNVNRLKNESSSKHKGDNCLAIQKNMCRLLQRKSQKFRRSENLTTVKSTADLNRRRTMNDAYKRGLTQTQNDIFSPFDSRWKRDEPLKAAKGDNDFENKNAFREPVKSPLSNANAKNNLRESILKNMKSKGYRKTLSEKFEIVDFKTQREEEKVLQHELKDNIIKIEFPQVMSTNFINTTSMIPKSHQINHSIFSPNDNNIRSRQGLLSTDRYAKENSDLSNRKVMSIRFENDLIAQSVKPKRTPNLKKLESASISQMNSEANLFSINDNPNAEKTMNLQSNTSLVNQIVQLLEDKSDSIDKNLLNFETTMSFEFACHEIDKIKACDVIESEDLKQLSSNLAVVLREIIKPSFNLKQETLESFARRLKLVRVLDKRITEESLDIISSWMNPLKSQNEKEDEQPKKLNTLTPSQFVPSNTNQQKRENETNTEDFNAQSCSTMNNLPRVISTRKEKNDGTKTQNNLLFTFNNMKLVERLKYARKTVAFQKVLSSRFTGITLPTNVFCKNELITSLKINGL